MRKRAELSHPESCFSRAHPDEWIFTLLGRDIAAPNVIRFWCYERIRLGKNIWNDSQIVEALACAQGMEDEQGLR